MVDRAGGRVLECGGQAAGAATALKTMTLCISEKRILEIASSFLEKGDHSDDGHCAPDWAATEEKLLEFARTLYAEGYENGYDDGGYYGETGDND